MSMPGPHPMRMRLGPKQCAGFLASALGPPARVSLRTPSRTRAGACAGLYAATIHPVAT